MNANDKRLQEILVDGASYRGEVLNTVIVLERMIDVYIAAYFCTDPQKRTEMILLLLGNERINFESKRAIFAEIIKTGSTEIKKDRPDIGKEITAVMEHRNKLAHYVLDSSPDALALPTGTIRLARLKNSRTHHDYTRADIDKIINDAWSITGTIRSGLGIVSPRNPNEEEDNDLGI